MLPRGFLRAYIWETCSTPAFIVGSLLFFLIPALFIATTLVTRRTHNPSPSCRIPGNQDMYGLGVRLGVYIQIFTTMLVDTFSTPDHAAAISTGNIWFLIALFVALCTYAWRADFPAIEGYVLLTLGNGITLTMLGGSTKLDPSGITEACALSFFRYALWAAWKVFSASFWWNILPQADLGGEGCPGVAWGWLFVRVDLMGWFRTFHKVFNIIEWVGWAVVFMPYPVVIVMMAVWLFRLNNKDWNVRRRTVLVDYMFIPTGVMHDIAFGEPRERQLRRGGDEETLRTAAVGTAEKRHAAAVPTQVPGSGWKHAFNALAADYRLMEARFYDDVYTRYEVPPAMRLIRGNQTPLKPLTMQDHKVQTFAFLWGLRNFLSDSIFRMGFKNFPFLFFWDFIVLWMTICTTELSVMMNGVTDVNYLGSAGQLVAFTMAVGQLMTAFASFWDHGRLQRQTGPSTGAQTKEGSSSGMCVVNGRVVSNPTQRGSGPGIAVGRGAVAQF